MEAHWLFRRLISRVFYHHRAGYTGAIKAGGNHRNAHFVAHVGVDHGAKDQVDVWVSSFLEDGSSLVDLEEGHGGATGHVEEDTARAVDGDVEKLAGDSHFSGNAGAIFTGSMANGHQGGSAFGHNGAHVCEVQVDQTGDGDQLGNALDALAQHVIGHPEGFL